ncbi:putative ribonuclease H-like domain-containing protein [Tanacetum coccineum]
MVPKVVLMRSGLVSLTIARPVNTTQPRTTVNSKSPMINVFNKAYLTVRRPINKNTTFKNSNFNQRVNTVKDKNVNAVRPKAVLNTVKGNQVNAVKASTYQGVIDSGCLRHMTRNMSYLTDYEEIDRRYVAFGGNPKGGKITRKGTIKTGNLDFKNVYFVRELKFNLFSVSHMCDKKNSVLFNDIECIVLSPNFKLTDESHVLLKFPRKNNMYSVDLKNIVPKGGLTCLFAKATSDESKLWHRRLGHINFKTMNKLVKGNLVRGLPSKLFEIYQTCVACQKGKQHRASYDYSRFSWVFFLATKDETSGILKSFITRVENLIDQRVKVIRVLVTKPHNKTPYELFLGRKPALGFMRPFGCPVTILNTIDHLGKFDGKADEGFFVGYSINRSGPNWLFDIDALTKSMNYKPVVAGNQSNGNAGTKACDDAGKARMETVPGKDYILLPLWTADPPFSQSSKSSPDAGFKPSGDDEKKVTEEPGKEGGDPSKEDERDDQEKDASVNSTNNVNAASTNEVNAVGRKASIKLPDEPNMPALEDIVYSDDDEDVGAEADMNNLDAFMPVSPIPTTRVHKDHPVEQIIRDLNSAPQTRRMTKNLEEHGLFSSVQQRTNHKDFQNCLFACFLSQVEPKKEVYVCQPPGFEDPDFPDRVYKVEKALYGLHQAPNAWYETLSTYLLDNRFRRGKIDKTLFIRRDKGDIVLVQVYVDDIIFGSTKKSLCTEFEKMMHKKFQMSSMGELTFFLGLQVKQKKDGIFITSTPMETQKLMLKDEDGEEVDVHLYRSMIGSLMYLTSSRPDIMYLKGQPKLGLWYPKDSPFDLVTYTDSDYARASLDRNSITGVNADDSKLMLLGINLLLLGKVNVARHKLTIAVETSIRRDLQQKMREGYGIALPTMPPFLKNSQEWVVQNQAEIGEGSAIPTDPHHTPTIIQPSTSQPQKKQISRRPKRKDTEVPQPSGPISPLLQIKLFGGTDDSLERDTTTATGLDIEQDRGGGSQAHKKPWGIQLLRLVFADEASLGNQEDASKQGRKIDDIDKDAEITLVDETQGRYGDDIMFDVSDLTGKEVFVAEQGVSDTLAELKSAKPTTATSTRSRAKGIFIHEQEQAPTPIPTLIKIIIKLDEEVAQRLQAEFDEQERIEREKAKANITLKETWG